MQSFTIDLNLFISSSNCGDGSAIDCLIDFSAKTIFLRLQFERSTNIHGCNKIRTFEGNRPWVKNNPYPAGGIVEASISHSPHDR
jgi:hypothetical protein